MHAHSNVQVHTYTHILCTHTVTTHTNVQNHDLQSNPDDEAVFQHLPAVMGVIMRTWHLLDIKKHITLSGLSPVYLLTAIWMMLNDGAKESLFFKLPVTGCCLYIIRTYYRPLKYVGP